MSYNAALLLVWYAWLIGMGTGYIWGRIHEMAKHSPEVPR